MAATKSRGVATTHPGFDRYAAKWKRCRDVSDGQDAVHAAGELYLRKLPQEDADDYSARKANSDFYNAAWRTFSVLLGLMFRKPAKVEVPKAIEALLSDIDLAGTTIDTFARQLGLEELEIGRCGIMVDHPAARTDDDGKVVPITVAAAEALGLRPSLKLYPAESIINWKYRRIRNRNMLAEVRLEECVREPDGEWEEKEVKQWRVLDLDEADQYRVRVYRREKEKDVLVEGPLWPLMNGEKLPFIPFSIVGIDGIESPLDEPPFIDLIDKNLAHYRVNSILQHTLYFAPPVFYISGYTAKEGEKISIGGSSALVFPDPNAKAAYAEPQGNTIPSLERTLDRFERQMAMLGARALADETKQAETLGATQIKRSGENGLLSAISQAVTEALEWALTVFAKWAGHESEIVYQLNRDFMPAMIDAPTLAALVNAVQAGRISDAEFFELMQRGDVIDSEKTFEEHQAEVEVSEGPARPEPCRK